MKTERNIITIDEYGRIHFPSITNNDIWMNTNELIELFGITSPTLRANIAAIHESGVLNEHDVQNSINLSNGISIDVYALLMIVALSFRLNTLGAYKVRECVMNKLATKLYSFIAHKLDNRYIAYLCYGSPNYKPRVETLDLCSSEHSKVCFQLLQMNRATSNLMFAGRWQGMF